jgi:lysozyme family protein
MDTFEQAFKVVIGHEGGYTANPADPGNWTGGRCGVGSCHGTNWGISAAAYPQIDIASLTLQQAQEIYRRDYWDRAQCGKLPAALALLVFDATVNNGVGRAIRWLQATLKVPQDGAIGPGTLAAIEAQHSNSFRLCAEFQANRLIFMAGLATWRTFGDGWARRLCQLPFEAFQMGVVS